MPTPRAQCFGKQFPAAVTAKYQDLLAGHIFCSQDIQQRFAAGAGFRHINSRFVLPGQLLGRAATYRGYPGVVRQSACLPDDWQAIADGIRADEYGDVALIDIGPERIYRERNVRWIYADGREMYGISTFISETRQQGRGPSSRHQAIL